MAAMTEQEILQLRATVNAKLDEALMNLRAARSGMLRPVLFAEMNDASADVPMEEALKQAHADKAQALLDEVAVDIQEAFPEISGKPAPAPMPIEPAVILE